MRKRVDKNKKNVQLLVILTLIILAGLLILILFQYSKSKNFIEPECTKNSDCLILRGSCCSCEDGGAPQCIPKIQLGEYTKKLELCSSQGTCLGLDCGKISCGCVNNKCVGSPA